MPPHHSVRKDNERDGGFCGFNVAKRMSGSDSMPVQRKCCRISFGNGMRQVSDCWGDIRYSLRSLVKRPVFSTVAMLTLALGIGANAAIFSVVNAVLLRQLPYKYADRAVWITEVRPHRNDAPFSIPDFLDYRDHTTSLDSISAVGIWNANLTGHGDSERLNGARVSANLFETLGVNALLGRTLEPDDDRPGNPKVIVISYGLWQRKFGGDTNVVGKTLDLNDANYTLVGVLPQNFFLPIPEAELAVPLVPDSDPWRFNRNTTNFLRLVGRIRAKATIKSAQAEMSTLATRLRQEFPEANAQKIGLRLTPISDHMTGSYRRALWVLLAAVAFVLLIACANLANLNLVRASARGKEMSVRSALGASRWQVMKPLLLESTLLATAGGTVGVLLARFGVRGLLALSPSTIPRAGEIGLNSSVLAFVVFISLASAMVTGLVPAFSVSYGDLAQQLNETSRGSTEGRRGKALRAGLVVVEVALCLILLAGAGVLLKSFSKLQNVEAGFDPQGVLSVRLSLPTNRYPHLVDVMKFYEALLPRVQALPGVEATAVAQIMPLSGAAWSIPFTVVGQAFSKEEIPDAQYRIVSPAYLKVMRIPLIAGREFNESDTARTRLVCYVNQTLAKRYWPQGGAVGAHLMLDDNNTGSREAEIVGVIHDVKDRGPETAAGFDVYIPLRQTHESHAVWIQDNQYWVLRTDIDPLALADNFRKQLRIVDSEVAASNVRSMDQYLALTFAPRRFNLRLLSIFAAAALVLALAGIYGVVSYSVSQRTYEIGVRMSVGAQRRDIMQMVITEGMKTVFVGLAIGVLGVFALTRALSSLVFAVSPSDPLTLLEVASLFCAASLAAICVPAGRAANINSLSVLRTN